MKSLDGRFGDRLSPSAYLAQLENRKLGNKEVLGEYAAELRKLVLKGYPTADSRTRDVKALRHFIRGLGDQQMTMTVGMKEHQTLEDALVGVEIYQGVREDVGHKQKLNIRSVQESTKVNGAETEILVDSGAMVTIVSGRGRLTFSNTLFIRATPVILKEDFFNTPGPELQAKISSKIELRMKRVKKSQDYKERLERALLFVQQDKIAVLKAAGLCGVPRRTLRKRLAGEYSLENPGRQQILTKKEEEQIVNHIMHLANCGYPQPEEMCSK
ncbi:hypothetical protein HOLleu_37231 [Holothuria leucospilota]|uniref:HTH psq-type domain-containing protein n=1 Tax=Holothuria leucospilota TaxID=206669 RepID=A0A9Q0YGT2_HOLLE|nr:hypothetical protein HOLleu_37231 [Holothuria leucospilota]